MSKQSRPWNRQQRKATQKRIRAGRARRVRYLSWLCNPALNCDYAAKESALRNEPYPGAWGWPQDFAVFHGLRPYVPARPWEVRAAIRGRTGTP